MKLIDKILLIIVFIAGIVLGLIARSWNSINWSNIEYGSVADWFSGIGTILAIISSIFIFIYSNRAKFRMQAFSNNDDSILELRVMNIGRTTGMYRYWGIKRHTDGKENLLDFSDMRFKSDSHFISLAPGEVSSPKLVSIGEIYGTIKYIPDSFYDNSIKVDIAILHGNNVLQELTVLIRNGKIVSTDNERIKK